MIEKFNNIFYLIIYLVHFAWSRDVRVSNNYKHKKVYEKIWN